MRTRTNSNESDSFIETIRERLGPRHPRVGAIVSDGTSEQDLCDAMRTYDRAGCDVRLIAPREGLIQTWADRSLGHSFLVDQQIKKAALDDLDLLFIPGGDRAINAMSEDNEILRFVNDFTRSGKPVGLAKGASELLAQEDRFSVSETEVVAVAGNVALAGAHRAAGDAAVATLLLAADRSASKAAA